MFINTNCDFKLQGKHGDFRDWFLEESINVHKTTIKVFLEDQLVGETLFPINLKSIRCFINTGIAKNNLIISNYGYSIPEMGIVKKRTFDKITSLSIGDTLSVDIDINLYGD